MEKVDRTHWERAELFEFFSAVSHPFYSVTFRVDVTNLYRYVKERHLSFYYAMGYLVTDAVNSVKNFRYAIRDGGVWLLDERIPSLTDLKPGSEQFHIVTLPKVGGIAEFCVSAQARSAAQKTLLDQDEENDNLIYISCTPWFDLTGCTNERDFDRDDNIPRITWGRYGGKWPQEIGDVGGGQSPLHRRSPSGEILRETTGRHRRTIRRHSDVS